MINPEPGNRRAQEHSAENQPDDAQRDPEIGLGRRTGTLRMRLAIDGVFRWHRGDSHGSIRKLWRHNQAVALAGNGFDVERLLGGIPQSLTELIYGGIYVRVVVDVGVRRPQAEAQLLTCHHLALLFDKG